MRGCPVSPPGRCCGLRSGINVLVSCAAGATLALVARARSTARSARASSVVLRRSSSALALLSFVLIRRALAPLHRLTEVIADRPGHARAPRDRRGSAQRRGSCSRDAFNGMLDRLESERRESGAPRARGAGGRAAARRARAARRGRPDADRRRAAAERAAARSRPCQIGAARDRRTRCRAASTTCAGSPRELRPEALDDLGLVNALIALCNRVDDQSGLAHRARLRRDLPPLPAGGRAGRSTAIAQEA